VEREANTLTLSFLLGRGQFATAVLRELCEFDGMPPLDADED
jgi:tRNA(Glu) U13 pseudouridine synthase TruD